MANQEGEPEAVPMDEEVIEGAALPSQLSYQDFPVQHFLMTMTSVEAHPSPSVIPLDHPVRPMPAVPSDNPMNWTPENEPAPSMPMMMTMKMTLRSATKQPVQKQKKTNEKPAKPTKKIIQKRKVGRGVKKIGSAAEAFQSMTAEEQSSIAKKPSKKPVTKRAPKKRAQKSVPKKRVPKKSVPKKRVPKKSAKKVRFDD